MLWKVALGTDSVDVGTVDIGLETHRAGPMDGPAYHRTAAAVARAREQGIGFALALPNVSESAIRVVEPLGRLHDLTMGRWSAREATLVNLAWGLVVAFATRALVIGL